MADALADLQSYPFFAFRCYSFQPRKMMLPVRYWKISSKSWPKPRKKVLIFSQAAEDLEYYLQNPLNLNTATYDELARIPILNEFQISKLLEYIHRQGPMFTLYELRLIDGFEMADITRLLPFVTLSAENREKSWQLSKALRYGKNDLFARTAFYTEKMEGYQDVSDSVRKANPEKILSGKFHAPLQPLCF